jgi:hypothetical protein
LKTRRFRKKFKLRRANLSGVRRTLARRSDFEMQRNAKIGLFAEPSNIIRYPVWSAAARSAKGSAAFRASM